MATKRRKRSPAYRFHIFTMHGGVCHFCNGPIDRQTQSWDLSHDIPLGLGGADDDTNIKPAHRKCHRAYTAHIDAPRIAKVRRQEAKDSGARAPSRNPVPGSRNTKFRKRMDGSVVLR